MFQHVLGLHEPVVKRLTKYMNPKLTHDNWIPCLSKSPMYPKHKGLKPTNFRLLVLWIMIITQRIPVLQTTSRMWFSMGM